MADSLLGTVGLVGTFFLFAVLIERYNSRWLTWCWVVGQQVSFPYVLYCWTVITVDG